MALQLRRGTNAERLSMTPLIGELIYVTDYELVTLDVTAIDAGTDTLTAVSHGLIVDQQIKFIGTNLNGLTEGQVYFIKAVPTSDTFTLSLTSGGGIVDITGTFTVDLVFATSPTNAAGAPLGTNSTPLWVGDGETVGGIVAASLNLDDLLDVEITAVAEGNTFYYDATTGFWRNTNIINVNDVTNNVTLTGDLAVNGGDITTTQTTASLFNATTTTANAFGAATAVNMGANTGTMTIGNPTVVGTQTTQNLYNTTATTVNAFGAGTAVNMGANTGTMTIGNPTVVGTQTTQNLYNTTATTANAFGAATAVNIGANSGTITIGNPTLVGTQTTQALYNTTATTVNAFGAATNITMGVDGAVAGAGTTTIRSATTVVKGDLQVNGDNTGSIADITTTKNSATVFNTNALTVDAFGAATALNMGSAASLTTLGNNLSINGDTLKINASGAAADNFIYFNDTNESLKWNQADTRFEFSDQLYISQTEVPAVFERRTTTAEVNPSEAKGAVRLLQRVTDAASNATDDSGPAVVFGRTSGAIAATEQLFSSMGSVWYGTLNKAALQFNWSPDNYPEPSPGVFPTTYTLLRLNSDYAEFFNDSVYVDYAHVDSTKTATSITGGNTLVFGSAHGYSAGDRILYQTATANGLIQSVYYYVLATGLTATQCQVSTISGGTAAVLTNGTGLTLTFAQVSNRIGINTITPAYTLDVNGETNTVGQLSLPSMISNTADPIFAIRSTSNTNLANRVLTLRAESTGTPTVGFGSLLDFEVETSATNTERAGFIAVASTDVTAASEDFVMSFGLMQNGATYTGKMDLNSAGDLQIDGTLEVDGNQISSSTATAITLSGADVTVVGDLTVTGTNITTGVTDSAISMDITTSVTNLPIAALTVKTTSTGTPAVGFGTAINFVGQTAASNFENAGFIAVAATDITSTSEDFRMRFGLMEAGGTYTTKMDLDSAGNLQVDSNLIADGPNIQVNSVSAAVDSFLYMKGTTEYLKWDNTAAEFELSDDLLVSGAVAADSFIVDAQAAMDSSTLTTTSTATVALNTTARNAMTGLINIIQGANVHCLNYTALRTGASTAMLTTYGEMYSGSALATFTADVSGGVLRLLVTPASATSTVFSVVRTSLT